MESPVATNKYLQIEQNSLRIVFRHKVVTLGFSAGATYEDIGQKLEASSKRRYGGVVAIHANFSPASGAPLHMGGMRGLVEAPRQMADVGAIAGSVSAAREVSNQLDRRLTARAGRSS